ncbi:uncharacterized protein LOC129943530 [Eupeodes corollae]|uniref:uncharacterized protein LOC129943530 n=1 Tax=Eupeodes corollae TaxID=290404 RepID=UPI0024939E29|nr:uncharacterized protein LOC129943530 [Eupeodes corollae]
MSEVSKPEEIVKVQRDLLNKVSKALKNYKKDPIDRHTKTYFEVRRNNLEKIYSDFQLNHKSIIQSTLELTDKYFTEDVSDLFEEEYIKTFSTINEAFNLKFPSLAIDDNKSFNNSGFVKNDDDVAQKASNTNSVRLPRIPPPAFSGKYIDWPAFYDSFVRLIHSNASLANIEKFHFLKQSLPSDFDSDIRDIPLTAANYVTAWETLEKRYNNKRVLFSHYMNLLSSQPCIQKESASDIKHLLDTSRSCVSALLNLKIGVDQCDQIIVHFLVGKLPRETHHLWEQELGKSVDIPSFQQFTDYLDTRYRILEAMEFQQNLVTPTPAKSFNSNTFNTKAVNKTNNKFFPHRETKIHHLASSQTNQPTACSACKEPHILRRCPKFLAMDCFERKAMVDQAKLCVNCLCANHLASSCFSSRNCQQCGKRHHTLLHFPTNHSNNLSSNNNNSISSSQTATVNQNSPTDKNTNIVNHVSQSSAANSQMSRFVSRSQILLPTAVVNVVTTDGQTFRLRALIDQGSTGALISERAAQSLNLERLPIISSIQLANGQRTSGKSVANLMIQSRIDNQCSFCVFASIVNSVTHNLPSTSVKCHNWPHISGLELADPEFYNSSSIDLLLGADILAKVLMGGLRKGETNEPVAQETKLGWIISGEAFEPTPDTPLPSTISCSHVSLEQLDALVKRFYTLESIPTEQQYTMEEKWCEEFFKRTHKRQDSGKYVVRLPLKSLFDSKMTLGRSKQMALNRFYSTERKLNNNQLLREQYAKSIKEYFDLNQIAPVETTENQHRQFSSSNIPSYTCCVLPHHAVIKTDSLTTQCRVVFDASATTSNGTSLNDILCNGPALQNDLAAVLLNWRLHKFVITADVKKMYRCIDMNEEDSQYQRILWRNENNDIQEFRLTTVTFGTASAPYTAIRVMHQLAEDERERFPLAYQVLKEQMYVDDIFTGGDTIDKVMQVRNQSLKALRAGGFELHKWASNTTELLAGIPLQQQSSATALELNSDEVIKTLGMNWQPGLDQFRYKINFDLHQGTVTKRSILSTIAKLFDPLGFINPIIVSAKIILKRLWSLNISFDEPISGDLLVDWNNILEDLPNISQIQIPRWLKFSPQSMRKVEIHAFCDGSSQAYASVVYLRIQDDQNTFHTNLTTAKSKVTPKPPISIPKIELCAAVLGIKLVQWVTKHIQLPTTAISIFYWTDATIVLSWIRGDANRWPVFVANRVGIIHAASNVNQWHHVATHDNPADLSSRGTTSTQLINSDLYWHGPKWLSAAQEFWPTSNWTFLETKQIINALLELPSESFLKRYSNFSHLRRIVAWILRFVNNCRCKKKLDETHKRKKGTLKVEELDLSLIRLVRLVQTECFPSDLQALLKKGAVSNKSQLVGLAPFLDNDKVLRVGGRLQRSALSFNEKHPMILPRDHHLTNLIISYGHQTTLHGGMRLTASFLRKKFWILSVRKGIQGEIRSCITCFKEKPRTTQQLMGSLPAARVNPSFRPFLATGVDYTGAIELKASRYRGNTTYKGYIAIFICLATKAIHLEAVTGMTTDQFLCALYRFIGRRGLCHDIYSDCGTNFIGANTVLKTNAKKFIESIDREIAPQLAEKGIQWHFNPPHSPNFGGLWEANVKSVKHHLKRITTGTPLTYEDLSTILVRIEACLNSRPLCPLTSDPDDLTVLTPGHFLIGDSLLAPPESPAPETTLRRQYLQLQRMFQQFWSRWSADWLSHLQSRPKWCQQHENLQVNDLVIIKDDRLPPNQWLLGRIIETHPGDDQLVRVVTVRTKSGNYKRCVSKICKLPIKNSLNLS